MAHTELLAEVRFSADATRLKLVRAFVRDASSFAGCSAEVAEQIVIAVNEGCMNVIQHAYKGDDSRDIVLRISRVGTDVVFRLIDFAEPSDFTEIKPRALGDIRPGGLGTHFMSELMDECIFGHLERKQGNFVDLKKKIA